MSFINLQSLIDTFLLKTAKPKIKFTEFDDGIVICGDNMDPDIFKFVESYMKNKNKSGKFGTFLFDPPYLINVKSIDGKLETWDKIKTTEQQAVDWMFDWTTQWWPLLMDRGAYWCWGGIGKNKFRPFFAYILQAEHREDINMYLDDFITWRKRRGFGVKSRMLWIREELALFGKNTEHNPRVFNIPYLSKERGYAGFNLKYPALSKYLRRGNVWDDINELFSSKVHSSQKPLKIIEIPIATTTNKGEWVLDIFAGSGSTGFACRNLGRNFVLIEKDIGHYNTLVKRMKTFKPGDKY